MKPHTEAYGSINNFISVLAEWVDFDSISDFFFVRYWLFYTWFWCFLYITTDKDVLTHMDNNQVNMMSFIWVTWVQVFAQQRSCLVETSPMYVLDKAAYILYNF